MGAVVAFPYLYDLARMNVLYVKDYEITVVLKKLKLLKDDTFNILYSTIPITSELEIF